MKMGKTKIEIYSSKLNSTLRQNFRTKTLKIKKKKDIKEAETVLHIILPVTEQSLYIMSSILWCHPL
jgi:hypothetical protein